MSGLYDEQVSSGGSSANASVGVTGAAVPADATYIGGYNGGVLQALELDSSGRLVLVPNTSINIAQVGGSAPSNTNPLQTQYVSQSGYVAASGTPPTVTVASTDTSYTFSSQVDTVILQNNTTATLYYAFDATASAGSLSLAPGQVLFYSKKVTVVHLYTIAAQNINGTTAGNIVLLGEL